MYKFFSIFASIAIALYFLGDPLFAMLGAKCTEIVYWYCNIPQYLTWGFSVMSGITLLMGVFQTVRSK